MMRLYLCGIEEDAPFNPQVHCCTDCSVFSFEMSQKEGEVAVTRVEVPISDVPKLSKRWVWISVEQGAEIKPLFKGICTPAIEYNSAQTAILTFWALPKTWSYQVAEIAKSFECDEIGFHEDQVLPSLEDYSSLWHFDPVTHEVSLSDLFQGRQHLVFGPQILAGSFKQCHHCHPYQSIEVEVIAEWVQQVEGELNLFPFIANRFPEQKLNTLTPETLMQSWPKEGTWLKRSGYYVTKSRLVPIDPPKTGGLDCYPNLTKPIECKGKWQRFRRYWLEGELCLTWQYRQKRRQRLKFTVEQRHAHLTSSWGRRKKLTFHVSNVENHLNSLESYDFFRTSQGYQAFHKALRMAHCHLAGSARTIRLEFSIPFLGELSLDSTIQVLLPETKEYMTGKLRQYRHYLTNKGWITDVKVAVTSGEGIQETTKDPEFEEVEPAQGLTDLAKLTMDDFVERIQLDALPEDQWQSIQETGSLLVPATTIQIQLKDLRSKDYLEQVLVVKKPLVWSAPC